MGSRVTAVLPTEKNRFLDAFLRKTYIQGKKLTLTVDRINNGKYGNGDEYEVTLEEADGE